MHHTPDTPRHAAYGRIHALKAKLSLPEPAYRLTLRALTGKSSCTDLDDRQLSHVEQFLRLELGRRAVLVQTSDAEALELLGVAA